MLQSAANVMHADGEAAAAELKRRAAAPYCTSVLQHRLSETVTRARGHHAADTSRRARAHTAQQCGERIEVRRLDQALVEACRGDTLLHLV